MNGEQNGMILETMEQHTSLHDEAPQGASFDYSFVDTVGRIALYDDLRSAMAEEGVIRLLLQDDSLFPEQMPVLPEDFSSPALAHIYDEMWKRRGRGGVASLAAVLGPEEMDHLTVILQKPESAANAPQALADYIRIIQEEYNKRAGDLDPLAAACKTYKDKKGYGGKRT